MIEEEEERQSYLEILRQCRGYYTCPKDPENGRRLGPLVGYAGTYDAPDGTKKHFVGDIYANFSKAEENPRSLLFFVQSLSIPEEIMNKINFFCGAPIGGYAPSQMLGLMCDRRVIKAEKKVIEVGIEGRREKSKLVFNRHGIESGKRYAIVEDVCNNFSTTQELINLIRSQGGDVAAIICLLNRSMVFDDEFESIPIISLIRMPIDEYRQEDPEAAEDIAAGNIVWKPKNEWNRLEEAMKKADQQ